MVDPGFQKLLTTPEGEIIEHPREFEQAERRLGSEAERGRDKNSRPDRGADSQSTQGSKPQDVETAGCRKRRDLFQPNNNKGMANGVPGSGHPQLRCMFTYKSPASGTGYVEVDAKFSTLTCSACERNSGRRRLGGLEVGHWRVSSVESSYHGEINTGQNMLIAGAGSRSESHAHA